MVRPLLLSLMLLPALPCHAQANSSTLTGLKLCEPGRIAPDSWIDLDSSYRDQSSEMKPYLLELREKLKTSWYATIPTEIEHRMGTTVIDFQILEDGTVGCAQYIAFSGDTGLDQAAWRGISRSTPFPALPPAFLRKRKYVNLRFHFYYNPDGGLSKVKPPVAYLPAPVPWRGPRQPVVTVIMPVGGAEPKGTYTPLPPASGEGFAPQSGTLLASLIISKNGQAKHVKVLQGISPQQDASTLKTLESWKFEPITRYNRPIEMEINVQVKFDLK